MRATNRDRSDGWRTEHTAEVVDLLHVLDLLPGTSQKVWTMTREGTEHRVQSSTVDRHRGVMTLRRHGLRIVRIAAALSVVVSLGGCAAMQQTVGGWFRKATPTPAPTQAPQVTPAAAVAPRVYYAGTEGLKVYSKPSASSKVIGQLPLHEKVTRFKLERGFAYVESATSGLKGWVNNSQLIWRLPTAPTSAAPAPAEAQPEEPAAPTGEEPQAPATPEATATAAEPLPTPTNTPVPAPPKSQATPGGVAPSIFNPY